MLVQCTKDSFAVLTVEALCVLSRSARAWTSVILAGKRGSRRHSTTGFSENVEVAESVEETSYQMLEVFSFFGIRRGCNLLH